MNPKRHPEETHAFGPPSDWDREKGECLTLSVRAMDAGHGVTVLQSLWVPTEEELASLLAGAGVRLNIYSRVHPVISISVEGHPE